MPDALLELGGRPQPLFDLQRVAELKRMPSRKAAPALPRCSEHAMHEEFIPLLKSLNIPLLADAEIAALQQLQKRWEHWEGRERQHGPLRVAEDQRLAFAEFLDNPNAETEQRMLVVADANLTGTRYALLRKACAALRGRISAEAAHILRPVLDRMLETLHAEHARCREAAEPVMSSKDRNPRVRELREAIEYADKMSMHALQASGGTSVKSPRDLAGLLMPAALTGVTQA
jgi:hypothetical protein